MSNRDKAIELLAKQFTLSHHLIWDRLPPKRRAEMMTYATTAVSTIERLQNDYRWIERTNIMEP